MYEEFTCMRNSTCKVPYCFQEHSDTLNAQWRDIVIEDLHEDI